MYKVIRNEYIGEDMYLMEVNGKFKGEMGQFYMLRAWDNYPLLSRPIEGFTALSCLRPDIFNNFKSHCIN